MCRTSTSAVFPQLPSPPPFPRCEGSAPRGYPLRSFPSFPPQRPSSSSDDDTGIYISKLDYSLFPAFSFLRQSSLLSDALVVVCVSSLFFPPMKTYGSWSDVSVPFQARVPHFSPDHVWNFLGINLFVSFIHPVCVFGIDPDCPMLHNSASPPRHNTFPAPQPFVGFQHVPLLPKRALQSFCLSRYRQIFLSPRESSLSI